MDIIYGAEANRAKVVELKRLGKQKLSISHLLPRKTSRSYTTVQLSTSEQGVVRGHAFLLQAGTREPERAPKGFVWL